MFICSGAFCPLKFKDVSWGVHPFASRAANTKYAINKDPDSDFFPNLAPILLWCGAVDVGRAARDRSAKQGKLRRGTQALVPKRVHVLHFPCVNRSTEIIYVFTVGLTFAQCKSNPKSISSLRPEQIF